MSIEEMKARAEELRAVAWSHSDDIGDDEYIVSIADDGDAIEIADVSIQSIEGGFQVAIIECNELGEDIKVKVDDDFHQNFDNAVIHATRLMLAMEFRNFVELFEQQGKTMPDEDRALFCAEFNVVINTLVDYCKSKNN